MINPARYNIIYRFLTFRWIFFCPFPVSTCLYHGFAWKNWASNASKTDPRNRQNQPSPRNNSAHALVRALNKWNTRVVRYELRTVILHLVGVIDVLFLCLSGLIDFLHTLSGLQHFLSFSKCVFNESFFGHVTIEGTLGRFSLFNKVCLITKRHKQE